MCCLPQQKGVGTPKHAHRVKNQTVRCVTIASMPYGVGTSDYVKKGIGDTERSANFSIVLIMNRAGTPRKATRKYHGVGRDSHVKQKSGQITLPRYRYF